MHPRDRPFRTVHCLRRVLLFIAGGAALDDLMQREGVVRSSLEDQHCARGAAGARARADPLSGHLQTPCIRLPQKVPATNSRVSPNRALGVLGAQMLASALKPMGRGLVHLAILSTASGWQIPSQESQANIVGKVEERARDRRRLPSNCDGEWSVSPRP